MGHPTVRAKPLSSGDMVTKKSTPSRSRRRRSSHAKGSSRRASRSAKQARRAKKRARKKKRREQESDGAEQSQLFRRRLEDGMSSSSSSSEESDVDMSDVPQTPDSRSSRGKSRRKHRRSSKKKKRKSASKKRGRARKVKIKTVSRTLRTGRPDTAGRAGRRKRRRKKAAEPASQLDPSSHPLLANLDMTSERTRSSLFHMLMTSTESSLKTSMTELVTPYVAPDATSDLKKEFTRDLVQFLFEVSGCIGFRLDVDECVGEDIQVPEIVQRAIDCFPDRTSEYPLVVSKTSARGKGSVFAKVDVARQLELFWELLFECLGEAVLDGKAVDTCVSYLSVLTNSGQRAFRHTACVNVYRIVDLWIKVRRRKKKDLRRVRKQLRSVKKEGKRKKALQKEKRRVKRDMARIAEIVEHLWQGVFVHRYKDVVPEIRALSLQALRSWVEHYPSMFLNDLHIRYFGWELYDKDPSVRCLCLKEMGNLFEDEDRQTQLANFTRKFMPRFFEMTRDVSDAVACEAVKLCTLFLRVGTLEDHEHEQDFVQEMQDGLLTPEPEPGKKMKGSERKVIEEMAKFVFLVMRRHFKQQTGHRKVNLPLIVKYVQEFVLLENEDAEVNLLRTELFLKRIFKPAKRYLTKWDQYTKLISSTGKNITAAMLLLTTMRQSEENAKQLCSTVLPVLPQWVKKHESDLEWVLPLLDVVLVLKKLEVKDEIDAALKHHMLELKRLVKDLLWKNNQSAVFAKCALILAQQGTSGLASVAGVWEDICERLDRQFNEDFVEEDEEDEDEDGDARMRDFTDFGIALSRVHEWMIAIPKLVFPEGSNLLDHLFFLLRRDDIPRKMRANMLEIILIILGRSRDETLLSRFTGVLVRTLEASSESGELTVTQQQAFFHLCDLQCLFPQEIAFLEGDTATIVSFFDRLMTHARREDEDEMDDGDEEEEASGGKMLAERCLCGVVHGVQAGTLDYSIASLLLSHLLKSKRLKKRFSKISKMLRLADPSKSHDLEFQTLKRLYSEYLLAPASDQETLLTSFISLGQRFGRTYSVPKQTMAQEEECQEHLLKIFDLATKYVFDDIEARENFLKAFQGNYFRPLDVVSARHILGEVQGSQEMHMSQDVEHVALDEFVALLNEKIRKATAVPLTDADAGGEIGEGPLTGMKRTREEVAEISEFLDKDDDDEMTQLTQAMTQQSQSLSLVDDSMDVDGVGAVGVGAAGGAARDDDGDEDMDDDDDNMDDDDDDDDDDGNKSPEIQEPPRKRRKLR